MKKIKILLCALFLVTMMVACSSSSSGLSLNDLYKESFDYDAGYSNTISSSPSYADKNENTELELEQKIIVDVELDIETKEFEKTIDSISNAVKKYNGYTQSSSVDDNYSYYSNTSSRYGRFVLRIPAESLDAFLTDAENYGNVVSTETSSEDVTTDYYDAEAQLEALRAQEKRLIAMYDKAEDIQDLISLENRLSDLRYEIDSLETLIRNYNLLTKYSTVTIYVEEVKILTEVKETFFGELKIVVLESLDMFLEFLKQLLFMLIYLLPYVTLVAIIAIPVGTWYVKTEPMRDERRRKQAEERAKKYKALAAQREEKKKVLEEDAKRQTAKIQNKIK